MSGTLVMPIEPEVGPASLQLRAVLSNALERNRPGTRIVDMERAPYPYSSSWWLEEITLGLDDKSRITLVFKDLVRETTGSAAGRVKPAFVTDPAREPWVYQNVLMEATLGPPSLWAAVTDFAVDRHWLFLERVNGVPLAEVGNRDAWCAAAEWLGRFHATASVRRSLHGPLLRHSKAYHRRWLARAVSAAMENARASDAAREKLVRLRSLASAHERATEAVLSAASSLIHGEFYPSNVLIEQTGATFAVHPVDWEMTAVGPPLLDLAALMSGRWSADDRIAMATAYREGARSEGVRCPMLGELLASVAACRLLLAVQWLGWSAEWTAPADHQNNWLEEAELCAREVRG
jgi:thiamine kinase-like enzyme